MLQPQRGLITLAEDFLSIGNDRLKHVTTSNFLGKRVMRIRQIKPEFWKHVGLGEISDLARLLFIGLWSMADCAGRVKDQAKLIKAELFTYSTQVDVDAIESMLDELASHEEEFIIRYEVDGKRYIQVSNFKSHQHLMGNEAKATSKYPVPTNTNKYVPIITKNIEPQNVSPESNDINEYVPVRTNPYPVPTSTTDIRSTVLRSNGSTDINMSDSDESTKSFSLAQPKLFAVNPKNNSEDFSEWYKAYPHKVKPRDAEKAYWNARKRASHQELMDGVSRYIISKPQYADWAMPSSWLNADRWLDQPANGINSSTTGHTWPDSFDEDDIRRAEKSLKIAAEAKAKGLI